MYFSEAGAIREGVDCEVIQRRYAIGNYKLFFSGRAKYKCCEILRIYDVINDNEARIIIGYGYFGEADTSVKSVRIKICRAYMQVF